MSITVNSMRCKQLCNRSDPFDGLSATSVGRGRTGVAQFKPGASDPDRIAGYCRRCPSSLPGSWIPTDSGSSHAVRPAQFCNRHKTPVTPRHRDLWLPDGVLVCPRSMQLQTEVQRQAEFDALRATIRERESRREMEKEARARQRA